MALALAGCGSLTGEAEDAGRTPGAIDLSFDDVAAPGIFRIEGAGRRAGPDAAPGLWAVVPGLPRPERAEVVHLETGMRVRVALFAGGAADTVRLSGAAADALGIGDAPAPVGVTALRQVPRIAADGRR